MSVITASCIAWANKKERSHPLSLRHIPTPLQGDVLMFARQTDLAIRKSAHLLVSKGHKKRSGIPIAPLETESAAGRDDAKRPPPSPMRWDRCECRERFPRKDPGVFGLLGSSLSCDTTGLTPPVEYLCLRFAERLKRQQKSPTRLSSVASTPGFEETATTAQQRLYASSDVLSAEAPHQGANAPDQGTPWDL